MPIDDEDQKTDEGASTGHIVSHADQPPVVTDPRLQRVIAAMQPGYRPGINTNRQVFDPFNAKEDTTGLDEYHQSLQNQMHQEIKKKVLGNIVDTMRRK